MAGLAQALEHFLAEWGYLALFLVVFVEEAGAPLPLPSEAALLYAGYLAAQGRLNPLVAGLVAALAATAGATLLYTLARRGGRRLVERFGRLVHLDADRLGRAEGWMARRGPVAVPLARLTPGLRIGTTVLSGLLRVPPRVVVPAVFGASLLWSYGWIAAGWALGDNWGAAARAFERAGRWGLLALALAAASGLVLYWLRRRRAAHATTRPSTTRPPQHRAAQPGYARVERAE